MASRYDMGTPLGGERKMRRIGSPLEEMDDMPEELMPTHIDFGERHAQPVAVTIEAIAGLLKKEIAPVQNSIKGLENKMEELSVSIDERLTAVEARLEGSEARIAKLEDLISNAGEEKDLKSLWGEIQLLKDALQEPMKGTPGKREPDIIEITAVIGGLGSLPDIHRAEAWITDQLWSMYGPQPIEVYGKGEYTGVVFAKFHSKDDRDMAVRLLRQARGDDICKDVWAKPDKPLDLRVCASFLFGLRWLLGEWGYKTNSYYIDTEEWTFKVGKEPVLQVHIADAKLQLAWKDPTWEHWQELQSDPQYQALIQKANERLMKSGKGEGKGKKGSAFDRH